MDRVAYRRAGNDDLALAGALPSSPSATEPAPGAALSQPRERSLTIDDVRALAWRQRWLVGISVLSALVLGLLITFLITPRYLASATVRVEATGASIIEGAELQPVIDWRMLDRHMKTLRQILTSRMMAERVVDTSGIARDPAALAELGVVNSASSGEAKPSPSEIRSDLIGILRSNVTMTVEPDSNVVSIDYQTTDPVLAARLANAYAETFIADNLLQQSDTNSYARDVLNDQIAQTRAKLAEEERKVIAYARANRLNTPNDLNAGSGSDGDGGNSIATLTSADLIGANGAYIAARNARILAQQKWQQAQRSNALDLPEARDDTTIQTLKVERGRAAAALTDALSTFLPDHPQVQEARRRLAALDAELAKSASNLRNSIRNEYLVAQQQENQFAAARSALAGENLDEQAKFVELGILTRNARSQREQLRNLLTRLNQVDAASDATTNNLSMVDRATVPTNPSHPSVPKNLALALLIGLLVGTAFAVLREMFDDTLYSPEDAERKLGYPLLGITPRVSDEERSVGDTKSALAEAYFSLRGSLDAATGGRRPKSILFTSSRPGEGKSTSSIALARDFASTGRRTLLIDGDLRNPSVHKELGIANETGFIEVLLGEATLAAAAKTVDGSLTVLTAGRRPDNPAQILSSDFIPDFFAAHQSDFDVIIVDSPPVMGLVDAPALASNVDYVVVVAEAGRAHFGSAKTALRRLRLAHARIAGVILTKFEHRHGPYGYGYGYEYYSYGSNNAGSQAA